MIDMVQMILQWIVKSMKWILFDECRKNGGGDMLRGGRDGGRHVWRMRTPKREYEMTPFLLAQVSGRLQNYHNVT